MHIIILIQVASQYNIVKPATYITGDLNLLTHIGIDNVPTSKG